MAFACSPSVFFHHIELVLQNNSLFSQPINNMQKDAVQLQGLPQAKGNTNARVCGLIGVLLRAERSTGGAGQSALRVLVGTRRKCALQGLGGHDVTLSCGPRTAGLCQCTGMLRTRYLQVAWTAG